MENQQKIIEEDKREIDKRLRLSDQEQWDLLPKEKQAQIVDKYCELRSIKYLGLPRILQENYSIRANWTYLMMGLALGILGNLVAAIFIKYEPNNLLLDAVIVSGFLFLLWKLVFLIDKLGVDHLRDQHVLDALLQLIEDNKKND